MAAISIDIGKLKSYIPKYVNEYYMAPRPVTIKETAFFGILRTTLEENARESFVQEEIKSLNKIEIPSEHMEQCIQAPLQVEKKIGEGAYGQVFKIKDQPIVAKIINIDKIFYSIGNKYDLRDKILQEVEISILAGKLGIGPKIHRFYICKSLPTKQNWMVIMMEQLQGKTLEEYKEEKGTINPEEIKFIKQKLREKLQILHRNNILHSDIHFGNIFLTFTKENKIQDVFLIDYGMSRNVSKFNKAQFENEDSLYVFNYINDRFGAPTDKEIDPKKLIDYVVLRMMEDQVILIKDT